MIGVAIIGLVACLHSEGLSRELADGSSPTAEPDTVDGGTTSVTTTSTQGDPRTTSSSPVPAEDSALGRSPEADTTGADAVETPRLARAPSSAPVAEGAAEADVEERRAAPPLASPAAELPPQTTASAGKAAENNAQEPGASDDRDSDGPRAGASATPSSAPLSEIPGPPTSMATLLGARRKRLEGRLGRDGVAGDEGWVHYGSGLAVRYESERAVEAALRVPAGLTCVEAARWAGFRRAMPPLYRVGGCVWPGTSARHRIHRGVVGELALATGILQVWSAKASR